MGKQKWTTKLAQELQPGDLFPGSHLALEVIRVEIQGENVLVWHYSDRFRSAEKLYQMYVDQSVAVARSGVKPMDIIEHPIIIP